MENLADQSYIFIFYFYKTALDEEFVVMISTSALGEASPPLNRSSPPLVIPLLPRRRAELGAALLVVLDGDRAAPSALPGVCCCWGSVMDMGASALGAAPDSVVRAGGTCWVCVGRVACLLPENPGMVNCDCAGGAEAAAVGAGAGADVYDGIGAAEFVCASYGTYRLYMPAGAGPGPVPTTGCPPPPLMQPGTPPPGGAPYIP